MKIKQHLAFYVLSAYFILNGLAAASALAGDPAPLLDKISNRIDSYPENNNIQYKIVKKYSTMDKNWQPKKTTVTKTIRKIVNGVISSEVLDALETEGGITKDIKRKTMEQVKKQVESENKKRTEQKDQNKIENPFDVFFPFSGNKRTMFEFKRLNDDTYNEMPVYIIEAVAKEKDEKLFDGKYYISKKTYDVIKARVKPSKKSGLVKEVDIDIEFQVLPEGNFMIKKMKTRADGGLLFMRMRIIQEDEYSDIKILN